MSNIKYSIILFVILVYLLYNHKPELFNNQYTNIKIYINYFIINISYYLVLIILKIFKKI